MRKTDFSADNITFRRTASSDLEALYGIFSIAEGELCRKVGIDWHPEPLANWRATQLHILSTDADRCFTAVGGNAPVGFSAAFNRMGNVFLAALFIHPSYQNAGIGRELCRRSLQTARTSLRTITDSFQPRSTGLYSTHGMLPETPVMELSGIPRAKVTCSLTADSNDVNSLPAIDAEAYGYDRSADHAFWRANARLTVWERSDKPVAYSYRWQNGRIGPVAGISQDDAYQATLCELSRPTQHPVRMSIPGSSVGLISAALESDLRFTGMPGLLLHNRLGAALKHVAFSGYWLM
jgi:GNAT superfamily N-acetyltransferase